MPIQDPAWLRADQWLTPGDPADGCDISIFGVPLAAGSLSGARTDLAPAAMRSVLHRFSTYYSDENVDLRAITARDGGDWDLAGLGLEDAHGRIRKLTRESTLGGTAAVFLGGDNSITRPIMQGTSDEWDRVFGLLTIDAHHDVRTLENGPTNGTPVRGLLEDGLSGERIAQIGIQSFANSLEYRAYTDHYGVSVRTMRDVEKRGIEEVVLKELHHLAGRSEWIYVDFDMDVLDVAYAPGCPGARPGGMTPRQLAAAAYLCGRNPKVIVADFVEVDPARDTGETTILNMAMTFLAFCAGVADRPLTA